MRNNKNIFRANRTIEFYIPNPNLIPRFNIDYNIFDLISSFGAAFGGKSDLSKLEEIFGKRNFFFTASGRSALYVILKSLNLPPKSKIGVPLFSCTSIFDAIIKAGHVPTFIDICLDNFTINPDDLNKKTKNLSAIIVIHTFGRPADMDIIKNIAKDIPVIEDCAHSLLSEYKGKLTGTIGDLSFFSFRSRKYISAGEGGMILLNNSSYSESFNREISNLKSYSMLNDIKHSLYTYATSFLYHKPWYGLFAFPIGSLIRNTSNKKIITNFQLNSIRRSDRTVFLKKLESFKQNMELQRNNSNVLLERLSNTSLKLPFENENTKCNYYLFPILCKDKTERDDMCTYLQKAGIDSAKLWSLTPEFAMRFYNYKGDCPESEKCANRILTIPNYYSLNDGNLYHIIYHVTKAAEELT
ncbi:MAG: DegT/DnrJ/EryC1/StrS family aminotransferase [Candidatus Methanoperedens sp.]|nr:DegT/DnrJ/EryC1/StrS family aminotransferase [Candidatus Methanoperedens sp.]